MLAVEVPVSEHNKPEVEEAKFKEIQNLEDYGGQECIGSRWVITQKDKHDGQKTHF